MKIKNFLAMTALRGIFVAALFCVASAAWSACREVSVFVQYGCSGKVLDWGHSGLAVDNEFYDFGPKRDPRTGSPKKIAIFTQGDAYDDKLYSGDMKRKDIRKYFRDAQDCEVWELIVTVTPTEAEKVEKFWKSVYAKFPHFNITGSQCSSMVLRSLAAGGLLGPYEERHLPVGSFLTPKNLEKIVRTEIHSTCGQQFNLPVAPYLLHKAKNQPPLR